MKTFDEFNKSKMLSESDKSIARKIISQHKEI